MKSSLLATARSRIGCTKYQLGVAESRAPDVVDCSSFVQWVFAQYGLILPRFAREQASVCHIKYISCEYTRSGDLLFARNKWTTASPVKSLEAVGHVGIVTERHTVIHVAWRHGCVIEESINDFMNFKNRGLWAGRL